MTAGSEPLPLGLLRKPTRYLFFTGKGGVGKTSLACAVALALSDVGRSVLLVSIDPASNLDEMLGERLTDTPGPVHDAPGLFAMNIDPEAAAESYRSLLAAGTRDPLLAARLAGERTQIQRVRDGLAAGVFIVHWQITPPVGIEVLSRLGGS